MQEELNNKFEDEIDLIELWEILVDKKWIVIGITLLFIFIASFYVIKKNTNLKQTFEGTLLVEVGYAFDKTMKTRIIEPLADLKLIEENKNEIEIEVPSGSTHIVRIKSKSIDEKIIIKNINTTFASIIDRHRIKVSHNKKYFMTDKIGDVIINDISKKVNGLLILIVAFITGVISSIFLVFFLDYFIRRIKKIDHK